jgi:hypothetical protein
MSLYKMFQTDKAAEQEGIIVDYGEERFRIARAGGANSQFKKIFAQKIKPYRRQIDNGTMDDAVANRLMAESYADAVVIGWESKIVDADGKEKWVKTIQNEAGADLKFTPENCAQVLIDLPELFADLQHMAGQATHFREEEIEEDSKN